MLNLIRCFQQHYLLLLTLFYNQDPKFSKPLGFLFPRARKLWALWTRTSVLCTLDLQQSLQSSSRLATSNTQTWSHITDLLTQHLLLGPSLVYPGTWAGTNRILNFLPYKRNQAEWPAFHLILTYSCSLRDVFDLLFLISHLRRIMLNPEASYELDTCNPSFQIAKTGGLLQIPGHTMRSWLKKKKCKLTPLHKKGKKITT